MSILIPYGAGRITYEFEASIINSGIKELKGVEDGKEVVKRAMKNPIGSKRLNELARGKKSAVIIISDHTRPVPSKDIIPCMFEELREGNPNINITLLVATGCHRDTTKEELYEKLGVDIVEREKIVIHDAGNKSKNVKIGYLPSGRELRMNRLASETDLLVAEGFIEPHFFAGFSGGRKSVLPGICDKATIIGNHCGSFIANPYARTGVLENNPIHRDMVEAARMARLQYIVNVIIDDNKKTVAAFAGDFEKAHTSGVQFLKAFCKANAVPADIVITSNGGAPLDQNLYQCVKGLTAAEASAKENAVVIMCAEMADGIGGDNFYEMVKNADNIHELYQKILHTPAGQTVSDQWQVQILVRILLKHHVIFVTREGMAPVIESMKMEYAKSLENAVRRAKEIKGEEAEITVIPDGVSVIIEK